VANTEGKCKGLPHKLGREKTVANNHTYITPLTLNMVMTFDP